MIEVRGAFNTAKVYTDKLEEQAYAQIQELCDQSFAAGSKIRNMPDTHMGKGCTIGTTMTIQDKVVPNLVGVDIGCGMHVAVLQEQELDFSRLDNVVRNHVPYGFSVRDKAHAFAAEVDLQALKMPHVKRSYAERSIGSLGGGNHFIEVNQDEDKRLYIVIHSGSRYLGKQIAEYYQEKAYEQLANFEARRKEIIAELKAQGRQTEIQEALKKLAPPAVKKELAYAEGELFHSYLHDMRIAQQFAMLNRQAMMDEIVCHMGLTVVDSFTTVHNYIDLDNMILRKGAISAQKNERVLIPLNMRDGSFIALGKGNPDWNFSGPHGAGRLMSRNAARRTVQLAEFEKEMQGVWSTTVCEETLDESPFVYKPMEEIIAHTKDTLHIVKHLKPLYNFKAT